MPPKTDLQGVAFNCYSPRMRFQWKYATLATTPFLNIGSGDDELHFGERAVHVDRLPFEGHKRFVQADAYHIPFADKSFDTVIMGDMLEHVERPEAILAEAARVCDRCLVLTVFEETREHPESGHIQWFTDDDMRRLVSTLPFEIIEGQKAQESHGFYNWLIAMKRSTPCASTS